jgi:hypothetical protein
MQWAQAAIWCGWFISLIETQIVPGSYLGFPNCTVRTKLTTLHGTILSLIPNFSWIRILATPSSRRLILPVTFILNQIAAIKCFCQDTTLFDEAVDCAASYCTPSDLEV